MIKLVNVSKKYKDIQVLKNINLEIPDGSRIQFKGINGSGKSVLFKLIVGYTFPDEGTIMIDKYTLGKEFDFIKNAGVIINAPQFMDSYTGLENLLYLANIRKVANKNDICKLADFLGLEQSLNKKYKTYSLGMRQKLRIIQAIMDKPQYLILDEPFDALDTDSQLQVLNLIKEYLDEDPSRTLLYISHNSSELLSLANKCYEIRNYDLVELNN